MTGTGVALADNVAHGLGQGPVGSAAGGREELLSRARVRVVSGGKRRQQHAAGRAPDLRIDAAGGPTATRA